MEAGDCGYLSLGKFEAKQLSSQRRLMYMDNEAAQCGLALLVQMLVWATAHLHCHSQSDMLEYVNGPGVAVS